MLATWNPFSELSRMQNEVDRLFTTGPERQTSFRPAVDIHEDKDAYTVSVELPGVKQEEVNVNLEGGVLTLSGERKFEKTNEDKEKSYRYVERSYGAFTRRFSVPETIREDGIEANMKDGVLTIRLPKQEQPKARKIEIKA